MSGVYRYRYRSVSRKTVGSELSKCKANLMVVLKFRWENGGIENMRFFFYFTAIIT